MKLAHCESTSLWSALRHPSLKQNLTKLRSDIATEHQWPHFLCCHTIQQKHWQMLSTVLTQMNCGSLPLLLTASWMKCQRVSWMHQIILGYFLPLSGLTVIFPLPPSFYPDTCGLPPLSWSKKNYFLLVWVVSPSLLIVPSPSLSFSVTLEETSSLGVMITS